jgi:hypothetical protein
MNKKNKKAFIELGVAFAICGAMVVLGIAKGLYQAKKINDLTKKNYFNKVIDNKNNIDNIDQPTNPEN